MFLNLNRPFYAPDDGTGSAPADAGGAGAEEGKAAEAGADSKQEPENLLYDEGKKEGDAPADDAAKVKAKPGGEKAEGDDKAEKSEEDKATDAETAKLAEVPEDGKYEFALPEGMAMDQEFADKASPILKEAGITRDQANKLAGLIAQDRKERFEAWGKTQEEWVNSAKQDKEFGGDKFDASIGNAKRVLDKFGTPELREYLTASGGGNNPEVIRFMARVGNAISDDSPPGSETPAASKPKDHAEILYGPVEG